MAASNAPNHDFAPSWLKIPDENNSRPNGSKSPHTPERNRQRRDENYHNRYGGEYPRGLNRQNSFEVFDSSKRYSPSHGPKYRHHSVEDEYYYTYGGYGYPYPYPYSDHYMQFASQPSLPRRDIKYAPQPQPRFGQVNGSYQGFGYPPFYDFFPHGEGFSTYGNGGLNGSKRSHYARDGRGESKDSDRSSHEGDDKDKIFNDDFPSLNGTDDDGDAKASKNTSSSGVWDNPPRSKFEDGELKNVASGVYKVVPSKSVVTPTASSSSRKGGRDNACVNGSLRDNSPLSSTKPSREGSVSSTSQPMEILSTRLARPKPSDMKKSQFLKALRKEADNENGTTNGVNDYHQESNNNVRKDSEENDNGDMDAMMNGVNDLHLDPDHGAKDTKYLSSSMEKEIMFMRSLGWNPNETESEITEDEKQEFLRISQQQQQQRNGRTRMLPKTWSPQHLASIQSTYPSQKVNEAFSSSDSDSDEDA